MLNPGCCHAAMLSVARTVELLADAFGAPVSTGWLASLQTRAEKLLEPFLETLRHQVRHAPVVHFDETGGRVEGALRWVHGACTPGLTLLYLAPGRSNDSIEAGGILGHEFNGVAVNDGLPACRKFPVRHGLCNAQIVRELAGIAEATGQQWPTGLSELLVHMLVAVNQAKAAGASGLNKRMLRGYRRRYDRLISEGISLNPLPPPTGKRGRPTQGAVRSLLRRLDDYREEVLRFATDFRGPWDNNQAERDIRMVKMQQKFSGSWRSWDGASNFLATRSYMAAARKQGKNVLEALETLGDLLAGSPGSPPPPEQFPYRPQKAQSRDAGDCA
ncbi:IS66 family transposase [Paeniglutamicibacter psychrophenolicus]|uniref:Transposase n=1 Tax=Paeniglutamicibacter psychrophenolicus TaxID=257454 RepID=A0ABS4WIK3_9MICC|nr:transposase [Paeniglutamicibacter psychrophenolicus]